MVVLFALDKEDEEPFPELNEVAVNLLSSV